MEKANRIAAIASINGNQDIVVAKAADVKPIPVKSPLASYIPVITITKAVTVHITIVSINGSNTETIPSVTGLSLLTAECAIGAEPNPASIEKAAL